MSIRISQMTAAGTLAGTELIEVSKLSTSVTITGTTISAQASDNSYNDSANGFVTAGFAIGDAVKVTGFTGSSANNITSGIVTAVTAGKLTIGGTDGNVIVDDAAGESVTIAKWITRRTTAAEIAATAAGKTALFVPASQMAPRQTAGAAALAYLAGAASQPDIPYLAFDPTSVEYAEFLRVMPSRWNEGTITFVPHWTHPATTVNFGVVWNLRAIAISNDDALAATFGTAQTSTDTGGTTSDLYSGPESSAITVGGTPAAADLVAFQIYRDPTAGADTMAVDAYLIGVTIFITTDAATDA